MADADDLQPQSSTDDEPTARRRVFHWIQQGIALVVLVVVVGGVYLYLNHADHAPEAQHSAGPQGPMPVGVMTVQPQNVPLSSQFLAQTEASQTVPIRARVSGYLAERAFEEGEPVEQGQLLFRIDPEPFEVALAQSQAQLAASQARLNRADRQLARFQDLAERQAATSEELEQWQEEQQVAAADVQLQQARIKQVQLDLDYARINAPVGGVIGRAEQDVGSYISPGGNALLATIRQVDPLYVRFNVSEQELNRWRRDVEAGNVTDIPVADFTVTVILPDGEVHPQTGSINFIDVAVDPSTGSALVRATVPNPENVLRPGQFVNVRISGADRLGAMLVPQSAVMQSPAGTVVYVVDAENTVQVRPVDPGSWYDTAWIIESGLEPGDRVVVDHLMQVRPGMSVEATEVELELVSGTAATPTQPAS